MYAPTLTWSLPNDQKEIFLTFDDGPHPIITPYVLKWLKEYDAKATFFCIGKNVKQYNDVYHQIIEDGHEVGNHTYNHVNGWKTNDITYLKDVMQAKEDIKSNIFRPPYGRIKRSQIKELSPVFNIIMWDVLSGDFDVHLSPEKCLQNVVNNVSMGSIVVFHDSKKAFTRLEYALPKVLEFFHKKGYRMKAISGKTGA